MLETASVPIQVSAALNGAGVGVPLNIVREVLQPDRQRRQLLHLLQNPSSLLVILAWLHSLGTGKPVRLMSKSPNILPSWYRSLLPTLGRVVRYALLHVTFLILLFVVMPPNQNWSLNGKLRVRKSCSVSEEPSWAEAGYLLEMAVGKIVSASV